MRHNLVNSDKFDQFRPNLNVRHAAFILVYTAVKFIPGGQRCTTLPTAHRDYSVSSGNFPLRINTPSRHLIASLDTDLFSTGRYVVSSDLI